MKVLIEGTVTNLGGIKLSDIEEMYIVLRTDKALVVRPISVGKFLRVKKG